jgi:hypothetical protein
MISFSKIPPISEIIIELAKLLAQELTPKSAFAFTNPLVPKGLLK